MKRNVVPKLERRKILCTACIFLTLIIRGANGRLRFRERRKETEHEMTTRVAGGNPILENRYPYLVPILTSRQGLFAGITRLFRRCGGTLIAPDVVLSAAHCVDTENEFYVQFHLFNAITLFVRNTSFVKTTKVVQHLVHPEFNPRSLSNDLVLFKLSEKNNNVKPVRLAKEFNLQEGDSMRTIGWGYTSGTGGRTPSLLVREANLNFITNENCRSDAYDYGVSVKESMMCASADSAGACEGDSGGPLFIPGTSSNSDVQYGVVSWGKICGVNIFPTVFARADYDWIMSSICDPLNGLSPESCVNGEVSIS